MSDVGVVIGRFQVPKLTDGHTYLIDEALSKHRRVIVLLGSSQEWGTKKNPLNYQTRARMIQEEYPEVITCPLPDFDNDSVWSDRIDETVKSVGWDVTSCVIYGGRNSFHPHYKGNFQVVICDSGVEGISGTSLRKSVGKVARSTEDFRRGVIYATQNPPNSVRE